MRRHEHMKRQNDVVIGNNDFLLDGFDNAASSILHILIYVFITGSSKRIERDSCASGTHALKTHHHSEAEKNGIINFQQSLQKI